MHSPIVTWVKIASLEKKFHIISEVKQTHCKECSLTFKTNSELKEHNETEHNETVSMFRRIARNLVEEKIKHKEICEWAGYCQHRTVCDEDCYFINKDFVEDDSDYEDNISDIPEEIIEIDTEFENIKSNQEISDNECQHGHS